MKFILIILFSIYVSNINANTVTAEDYKKMIEEKDKNQLRFERKYNNLAFSSKANFNSASRTGFTLGPEYMIDFTSNGVEILCGTDDKKVINLVASLDKGDLVQIDANFKGNFLTSDGFVFGNCKVSKAKK